MNKDVMPIASASSLSIRLLNRLMPEPKKERRMLVPRLALKVVVVVVAAEAEAPQMTKM